MVGNAGQDLAQVGFRVEAVEFGRADQAVNGGRPFASGVGTGEEIVFPFMEIFP